MRKWIFVLLLLVALNNSSTAVFVDQLQDQYDDSWYVIGSGVKIAQTFTPSKEGQLDGVSIKFGNFIHINDTPQYPVEVSIVQTVGLVPSGMTLGSVMVNIFEEDFTFVDFSDLSIYVDSGVRYGILVSNDDSDIYDEQSTQWRASMQDLYSGGSAWIWHLDHGWIQESPEGIMPAETYYDKDLAFITYVVPEPTTALLLSLGFVFSQNKRNK